MNAPSIRLPAAETAIQRRRTFTREFKRKLVEQTLAPGASVSGIALANGINTNQLFAWRRQLMPASALPPQPALLPVHLLSSAAATEERPAPEGGTIDVILANATVHLHGQVDPDTVRTVLQCLLR